MVVTTGTLTRLIAELRRLLGDDAIHPRYIETVHTKGYRWIAAVSFVANPTRRSAPREPSIGLIGREEDLSRLQRLAATARLLTLVGPGGTGKTQLALEYARRHECTHPNSVVWIDLTAAGDECAMPTLIASGLDLQIGNTTDFAADVARAVGDRTVVLPLPGWQYAEDPVASLLQSAAARLLNERACAVSPYFELTRHNAGAIADICRRLDGLPLALELAAARLTILSPQQLLVALDDRFNLLSRQSEAGQLRHGSLRQAIEWSYELLEPAERKLLDGFGVFSES